MKGFSTARKHEQGKSGERDEWEGTLTGLTKDLLKLAREKTISEKMK